MEPVPSFPSPQSTDRSQQAAGGPLVPAPHDGDIAATFCATLLDEWVRLGLRHAVISPGSRSTPMALALAADDRIAVELHHDERSASFMALGQGLAMGIPALLLCTSGTAAAEFHPAVVEAHQAGVPMLVITADRPPELQGVGAPQTIDQREIFGKSVRWYCEPGPPTEGGTEWWRALATDAWVRTGGTPPGPVHLNLAFREPLVGTPRELPPVVPRPDGQELRRTVGAHWNLPDEELGQLVAACAGRRGIIVAGVRAGRTERDREALLALAEQLSWPVLADAQSGCRVTRNCVISRFDPLLREPNWAAALRPEVVLRVGGLLSSKVTGNWLAQSGAMQIGIDSLGLIPDPDRVLVRSLVADVGELCDRLAALAPAPAPTSWLRAWATADAVAGQAVEAVFDGQFSLTEPGAVVAVATRMGPGKLMVSSSMPVRDLEWFAPSRNDVTVFSNRGANGIDGVTSTAIGIALTGGRTTLITGDVAFLHDSNALLGLRHRNVDLCIVVIDNDGGGIFSFLPQREALTPDEFESLYGTPHGVDLVALTKVHGVPAERVGTREGLAAALRRHRGTARVVVVGTGDRDANVAAHSEIAAAVASALGEAPKSFDDPE